MNTISKPVGDIRYVVGDATAPEGEGPRVITHVCNDLGRWGRGFVVPLGKRWPEAKRQFLAWGRGEAAGSPPFELGQVQFVQVEPALWVANLVGQHGLKAVRGVPPVRYDAIRHGLPEVATLARGAGATVHMPRIACGLAGGTWDRIEPILREELVGAGVDVVVYDLPSAASAKPG